MWKGRAQAIFGQELEAVGWSTDYDNFSVQDEPNEEAANLSWWRETDDGAGETQRSRAYLKAYLRIASNDLPIAAGNKLRARGITLSPKGRIWMDRYVIGKMHGKGVLEFVEKPDGMHEPAFVLTPQGVEWVERT